MKNIKNQFFFKLNDLYEILFDKLQKNFKSKVQFKHDLKN